MESLGELLLVLGAILLIEPLVDALAVRVGMPRISLLLGLGLAVSPLGMDLIPAQAPQWFEAISEVALAMVGLLLGGELTRARLRAQGRDVLVLSLAVTLLTWALVAAVAWVVIGDLAMALVLGTAATATDPAACAAVVKETGSDTPASRTILGVVAIDDVYGVALFSVVLAVLGVLGGDGLDLGALVDAGSELGLSVLVGMVLGFPMAWLTGRLKPGEPTMMEGLGFVLLACGVAEALDLSYLLVTIVMGATVANVATHHAYAFRELEHVERPFLAAFFVLSGATVQLEGLAAVVGVVLAYLAARVAGRVLGGWLASRATQLPRTIGLALLPQAGVALGMTLVAVERYPSLGRGVLQTVVLATLVFEILGPLLTRWVLRRTDAVSSGS